MSTISRKQREILDREQLILRTAREIFRTRGYLGLNMNRVAEELQYAKGTIYQHFKNKEEIILAMAAETLNIRTSMFERASEFKGKSRQRMAAIGCAAELFVKWYPDHFELEKVLSCSSIIEKTDEKLQEKKNAAEMKCVSIVAGVVRDGIAAGDLKLDEQTSADKLVFGLWSITYGGYSVMSCTDTMDMMGIADGFQDVRDNCNRFLDGYGWKTLSTKFDYNETYEKVSKEKFSDGPIRN
jgi:AcrR family transcriptional regulator